jgi:uncharacterized protein (TIGR02270 family)
MSTVAVARPVLAVVQQHAEDAAVLARTRSVLAGAPHAKLRHLRRLDDRLEAHLDGLRIAGALGAQLCDAALARPGAGEAFVITALALDAEDGERLGKIFALAETLPTLRPGVVDAFEWAPTSALRGITTKLMQSPDAFQRTVGIAACESHGVDAGDVLAASLVDTDVDLRSRALRAAGACGRTDLIAACMAALNDDDPECRFQSAQSLAWLGEQRVAADALNTLMRDCVECGARAAALAFKLATFEQAAPMFKTLLDKPEGLRTAIRGAGIVGDPQAVAWLIEQMDDPKVARLAGEAFSLMTGADLAWLDLERKPPDGGEGGPTDDPADDDVSLDEDESLPWPDSERVRAWWSTHAGRFQAGERHFMGAPPSWSHCVQVLGDAGQRQRLAAAEYLCLLRPGTPLFQTSAPAWRQSQWLAQMADA